jgi:hypothetical protein
MARAALVLALVAALALGASAQEAATCPTSPASTPLEFGAVGPACGERPGARGAPVWAIPRQAPAGAPRPLSGSAPTPRRRWDAIRRPMWRGGRAAGLRAATRLASIPARAHARGSAFLRAARRAPPTPHTPAAPPPLPPRTAADATDFCATCICSLVDALAPAFAASGLKLDPANPAAFPIDRAAGVITGCVTAYFSE